MVKGYRLDFRAVPILPANVFGKIGGQKQNKILEK